MLFTEPSFLFLFLPATLLLHACLGSRMKNVALCGASLFFYFWGEGTFVILMLVSISANYLFGRTIEAASPGRARRLWLALAVATNLSILVYFKYTSFLIENLNVLMVTIGLPALGNPSIPLPLGISFLTFHTISYVVDVYRRTIPAERNANDLGLYLALFPHLIAGPIVRYADIVDRIKSRSLTREEFAYGIRRFIIGLSKKMLLANSLGTVADQVFSIPAADLVAGTAWLGVVSYTFQIYFDFAGYSDMAIGLAHLFGFTFHENFDYPYSARSLTEFWRRWHISLSTWFRDYLYIPLGGSQGPPHRVYLNLLIVFVLCGFWHGASWSFLVWGLFHGTFLILERLGLRQVLQPLGSTAARLYLMLVVMGGWVFFRAETLTQAIAMLRALCGFGSGDPLRYHPGLFVSRETLAILGVAAIASQPVLPWWRRFLETLAERLPDSFRGPLVGGWAGASTFGALGLFLWSLTYVAARSYNPFIYFRF